jgi:GMP synthase-like glutamine amidotransferase
MSGMDLCLIEQEPEAPGGLLAEWAHERGHSVEVLRFPQAGALPDPREFDVIAPLGSEHSVHASPHPWIPRQVEYLRSAHDAGVGLLGICFGGQAVAAALGAKVWRTPEPEIGWVQLESLNGGEVPEGPWLAWHSDAFAFPEGAERLARTPAAAHAFRMGKSFGLQFHPEVTPEILEDWIRQDSAGLEDAGVDPDTLRGGLVADEAGHRERAFRLFDAISTAWTFDRGPNVQD